MLTLRHIELPCRHSEGLSIFASPDQARQHLSDHVLTRPEAQFWAHLIPDYTDWLDPSDDDALFRFAKALWSERVEEAVQALYDGYAKVIGDAVRQALKLGWYWIEEEEPGPCWRGVGLSGAYVIWRRHAVRTAMLLSYAAPRRNGEPPVAERRNNPLPRQNTWVYRGARLRHDQAHYPPVPHDRQQDHYQLFKHCAVRVRREFKDACRQRVVRAASAGLGSLREHVPDLAGWNQLCRSEREAVVGRVAL